MSAIFVRDMTLHCEAVMTKVAEFATHAVAALWIPSRALNGSQWKCHVSIVSLLFVITMVMLDIFYHTLDVFRL